MCCIILVLRPLPSVVQRLTRPIRLPLLAVLYLPLPTPLVTGGSVHPTPHPSPSALRAPRISRLAVPLCFPQIRSLQPWVSGTRGYAYILWVIYYEKCICGARIFAVCGQRGGARAWGKRQVATGCPWYLGTREGSWGTAEGIGAAAPAPAPASAAHGNVVMNP